MSFSIGRVEVFRFKKYDISTGKMQHSRQFATREGIKAAGCLVEEETCRLVECSILDGNGMTALDFVPPEQGPTAPQTSVKY